MKQWNKIILTLGVLALFCSVVSPFGGIAFGATPVVTVLPVFREGTITPTRLALDASIPGNIYVSDPHAEGILKFNSAGKLLQKFPTVQEPGGVAFATNGDLLVTQGTYVVALDPVTGFEKARFGTFLSAFAITVDTRSPAVGGTGRIYVSDIADYCIQVFSDTYSPVTLAAHNPAKPLNSFGASQIVNGAGNSFFNRPAGVTFEKALGRVAVVDSLNGRIRFFTPDGVYLNNFGGIGYDPVVVRFTYPQSIAFEYTDSTNSVLSRAYVLDTNQDYVMALDVLDPAATAATPSTWKRILDIGAYGHANGNLIAPSDLIVDTRDPNNNRLFVTNGFGSVTVYGLSSLQPYNVTIDSITNSSMKVNWSIPSGSVNFIRVYRSIVEGQLGTQVGGDLPATATSFTDSSLAQYTTYFYTIRAVDASNVETTNVSQVSAKTTGLFNLSVNINGAGSVNGSTTCTGGTCISSQISDALITLTATASGQSVFSGWTGDCFTTADTCLLSMDSAKSVTAFFAARLAFHVDGAYYDNLQDAYSKAQNNSVIKVLAGTWPSTTSSTEYMTAWQQGKTVYIEGGYDAAFESNAGGSSTVIGRTNLTAGKVVMKQFKLK